MGKEVTVRLNIKLEELINYLKENNYKEIDNYIMTDLYYVKDKEYDKKILPNDYVLIRKIENYLLNKENKILLSHKQKEYSNKELITDKKTQIQIYNIEETKNFLETFDYKSLLILKDHIIIYAKNNLELCIQEVNDKYLYLEIETNKYYDTIEKLKQAVIDINLPYDDTNYFVSKAQDMLEIKK